MKIKELFSGFTMQMSNEEANILKRLSHITPIIAFPEREQFIIENLIRKSLVTKIRNNGMTLVIANEYTDSKNN
jgi:hypothetical protein